MLEMSDPAAGLTREITDRAVLFAMVEQGEDPQLPGMYTEESNCRLTHRWVDLFPM